MKATKEMATLMRLEKITSGPYQDEEFLDFMYVITRSVATSTINSLRIQVKILTI